MLRGFTDSTGTEWRVWEVLPNTWGESISTLTSSAFKETVFANGWLCFESAQEKRRLAPIPAGWELTAQEQLEALCGRALPVAARRARAACVTATTA